jgi:hypothetical protein
MSSPLFDEEFLWIFAVFPGNAKEPQIIILLYMTFLCHQLISGVCQFPCFTRLIDLLFFDSSEFTIIASTIFQIRNKGAIPIVDGSQGFIHIGILRLKNLGHFYFAGAMRANNRRDLTWELNVLSATVGLQVCEYRWQ